MHKKQVAAGEGVGPSYRDSKSRVLPLDDPAIFTYTLHPSRYLSIKVRAPSYSNTHRSIIIFVNIMTIAFCEMALEVHFIRKLCF